MARYCTCLNCHVERVWAKGRSAALECSTVPSVSCERASVRCCLLGAGGGDDV